MSDLGWFASFAVVALIMIVVSGWIAWFSRRSMKAHKTRSKTWFSRCARLLTRVTESCRRRANKLEWSCQGFGCLAKETGPNRLLTHDHWVSEGFRNEPLCKQHPEKPSDQ